MKGRKMKNKLPPILFALIVGLALFGGTWQMSPFAATVPPVVPEQPVVQSSPPVSGTGQVSTTDDGNGARIEITNQALISVPANTLQPGTVIKASTVISSEAPSSGSLSSINNVLFLDLSKDGVSLSNPLTSSISISMTLSDDQIEAFKKDPTLGVQWYDPDKKEWVKLPASLVDGKLVFETKKGGYFAFGSKK
jgi:hypothetical protein